MGAGALAASFTAGVLLASSVHVRADDVADVMEKWGILGTWAPDCAKPPAATNYYYAYMKRDGAVFLDRDGGSFRDSSPIVRARVKPDGMLEYRVLIGRREEGRLNTFGKRGDGRIRIFDNRSDAGQATVELGRLRDGPETEWSERCPPGTAAGLTDGSRVALMP